MIRTIGLGTILIVAWVVNKILDFFIEASVDKNKSI